MMSNQDLKGAGVRFRAAGDIIRFNRAAKFPMISVGPSISSLRDSAHRPFFVSSSRPTGDFVLPFDLSYELGGWGRVRQTVAAAREEGQASAAELESVRLSLQAELACDYFELGSADARKELMDCTVAAYVDA